MRNILFIICLFTCSLLAAQETKKVFDKGNEYYSQKNYQKALVSYKIVLALDSQHLASWINSGLCNIELKKVDDGIECFKNALQLNPKSYKINMYLGDAYQSKRDFKSAITFYQNAKDLGVEDNSIFYFNLGSNYYFNGNNDTAIKYLEQSYTLDPSYSGTLNNLAWAHLDKDPKESCRYFREAYVLDSLNGVNINNLGYAHLMCGDLEIAYKHFLKAKELEPKNSFIYRNIGLYYKEKGKKTLSCEYLQKAIDLNIISLWGEHYISDLTSYCKE